MEFKNVEVIKVKEIERWEGKKGGGCKQGFLGTMGGKYKKEVYFVIMGEDKVKEFDVRVGDTVTAQVDVESREVNSRYYTDLKVWKLEKVN